MNEPARQVRLFGGDAPRTTDEWYTPSWIFNAIGVEFNIDVCAPADPEYRSCPARRYFTADDDGLAMAWTGTVWMNPPYSKADPWVRRWARHPDGLALLPALPEVHWRGTALGAAETFALLAVEFNRPDGTTARLRWPLMLLGRGTLSGAVARVAACDQYADGAFLVAPWPET